MFGHMLQQKINRDFQTDWSQKVKSNENTSDHFIVSKEILKTDSFPFPSLFQFIGVTDRRILFYQNDMAGEPDFCRDIIETRIKGILKEHLKISRDITFLQVLKASHFIPPVSQTSIIFPPVSQTRILAGSED